MLPKPSTSPSCSAKTTHYWLLLTTMKTATHRDNGKCDRVVWIKTKKKIKVWLKPCLLACAMCSVCVGVRAGTIKGTVYYRLLKTERSSYQIFHSSLETFYDGTFVSPKTCHPCTKDNRPWATDWITPSLEISYPSEEWCSDLTGRCVDPTRTRQSKQRLRGVGG